MIPKKIALFLVCTLFISIVCSIAVHETGHYLVAQYYGANPEYKIQQNTSSVYNIMLGPEVFVRYTGITTPKQDILIAFFGPLFNFIFAGFAFFLWKTMPQKEQDNIYVYLIFSIFILTNVLSGVINLIPFKQSDGFLITQSLKTFLH